MVHRLVRQSGVALLSVALSSAAARPSHAQVTVIDAVTVVDVEQGALRPNLRIRIAGNRIVALEPSGGAVPAGATVVDGRGQFLIPGLWDAHVHAVTPWSGAHFLPLLLAHGVTAVRDLFTTRQAVEQWRTRIAQGFPGPRVGAFGALVDGDPPIWGPQSVVARSPADGRRLVDSLAAGGGFVKVYSRLDSATYVAIARQASTRGVPFAGHVPQMISAAHASDLGQRTIEHSTQLLLGCSAREQEYLAQNRAAWATPAKWDSVMALGRSRGSSILDSYDESRCRDLAARLKRNGTVLVPTITVLRSVAYLDDTALARDPRLKYIPAFLKNGWNPRADFRFNRLTPSDWTRRKAAHARELEVFRLLHQAGVPMLAGTDLANPYIFPGSSLHDELANLVAIGMTPAEALQAATIGPARLFGLSDSLGAIAPGQLADLVLLDADPLADIQNVRRVATVVADGRVYGRDAIARLLAEGEGRAARPPGG